MIREQIDFHVVEPHHDAIHSRLLNWARWCWGGSGHCAVSPMFRLYRPDNWERLQRCGPAIDGTDAQRIMRAMFDISVPHRIGLNWWYLCPKNPRSVCRRLDVSMEGLWQLIDDARTMLQARIGN